MIAAAARRGHYLKDVLIPDVAVTQWDGVDLLQSCSESGIIHSSHLSTWAKFADHLLDSLSGYSASINVEPEVLTLCVMYSRDGRDGKNLNFRQIQSIELFDPSAIVAKAIIPNSYITSSGILLAELSDHVHTEYLPYDRSSVPESLDGIIPLANPKVKDTVIAHSLSLKHLIESCFTVKVEYIKLEFLDIKNQVWLRGVTQISIYQRIPCSRIINEYPDTSLTKLKEVRHLTNKIKSVSLQKAILSRLSTMLTN